MTVAFENRYVLEVIDPSTASISHEVSFVIKDLPELLGVLGATEPEFQPGWTHYPNASLVAQLKQHYNLNFDDHGYECALRSWHRNDDLPYKVHTGRELAMMLKGTKPLASFIEDYPKHHNLDIIPEGEFEPHVGEGRITFVGRAVHTSMCSPASRTAVRCDVLSQSRCSTEMITIENRHLLELR